MSPQKHQQQQHSNLLHSDAGYNSMFPHLDSLLVQRKPGNEPGGLKRKFLVANRYSKSTDVNLKKKDEGDADGRAHAEGLKAGHDGEGTEPEGHDVGDGGDGDGDARMTHCLPDLEDRDVKRGSSKLSFFCHLPSLAGEGPCSVPTGCTSTP